MLEARKTENNKLTWHACLELCNWSEGFLLRQRPKTIVDVFKSYSKTYISSFLKIILQ